MKLKVGFGVEEDARSACAVRTFSRAVDRVNPQRHASHSAQLRKPHFAQPKRSSNSRTSISKRYVSAFICRASVQIAASSSSMDRWSTGALPDAVWSESAVMEASFSDDLGYCKGIQLTAVFQLHIK